jgi:DNA-directed RNA polymerase specialized sigma24 family protein
MSAKIIPFPPRATPRREASDAELLAACAEGRVAALGMLWDRHAGAALRVIERLVDGDRGAPDELLQASFRELWRRSAQAPRGASVRALLLVRAAELASAVPRPTTRLSPPLVAVRETPEATSAARVAWALGKLAPSDRVIVALVDGEGIDPDDAARALRTPRRRLSARLDDARARLAPHLAVTSAEAVAAVLAARGPDRAPLGRGRERLLIELPAPLPARIPAWRLRLAAVGVGLAAMLVLGVVAGAWRMLRPRARVEAEPSSRFEHRRLRAVHDGAMEEVLRLVDGRVRVDLRGGVELDRFRIETVDAEVDAVDGELSARADVGHLVSVEVRHGRAMVRPRVGTPVSLGPGERWPSVDPAPRVTPIPPAPIDADAARLSRRAAEIVAEPTPRGLGPGEQAFRRGWASLSGGAPEAAARAFADALARDPLSGVAEDAAYFRGLAFDRAGDSDAANRSDEAFFRRFTASHRAGEVALRLGWRRLAAGDAEAARAWFSSALDDVSESVRAGAEAGLAAAGARR